MISVASLERFFQADSGKKIPYHKTRISQDLNVNKVYRRCPYFSFAFFRIQDFLFFVFRSKKISFDILQLIDTINISLKYYLFYNKDIFDIIT